MGFVGSISSLTRAAAPKLNGRGASVLLVSEDLEFYQRIPAPLTFSNWRENTHLHAGFMPRTSLLFQDADKRAVKFDS